MEYAGYQATQPLNWQKIFEDASSKISGAIEGRKAEREELDQQMNDAVDSTYEYTATKSPTFNDFMLTSADSTRNFIKEQNRLLKAGQITPSEYKRRVSNTQDSWKRFAMATKNYDKNFSEMMERDASNKSSGFEKFLLGNMLNLTDLSGMQMIADPATGRQVLRNVNGSIYDLQTLDQVMGERYDRVDVYGEVNKSVKMLGKSSYTAADGSVSIKDKVVKETKPSIINAILSNDTRAASIMVDNMDGYSFTWDKSKVSDKTILVEYDQNGIPRAKLSDKQKKDASKFISGIIDSELSSQYSKPQKSSSGSGKDRISPRLSSIQNILNVGTGSTEFKSVSGSDAKIPGYPNAWIEGWDYIAPHANSPKGKYILKIADKDGPIPKEVILDSDEMVVALNNMHNSTYGYDKVASNELLNINQGSQKSSYSWGSK